MFDHVGDVVKLTKTMDFSKGSSPEWRFIVRPPGPVTLVEPPKLTPEDLQFLASARATTSSPLLSLDGFTAFAQCLRTALDQIQKDIAPLQKLVQQQQDSQDVPDKTLEAVNDALRTTAEAAVTIHRTASPLLNPPASKPVNVHNNNPGTAPMMYCDTCYKIIEG